MKEIMISGASPVLMPREDPAGKIVFAIVLMVFILVCFVALMTFMAALMSGTNERSKKAIADAPLRMLLLGFVGYAVFAGLAVWLYSLAFIERLLETEVVAGFLTAAVIVTVVPLAFSLLGAPGLFCYVGDRLAALHGGEMSGLRRIVLGTCVSVFAALFPIVGWFIVLPVLLVLSLGMGASTLIRFGAR